MNNIQLVIPMSGKGFRFLEKGYSDPKPLINVEGKPMIEHVVNLFPGVEDVLFICREEHLNNTNMSSILKNISPKCEIISLKEDKLLGPVDTVSKAFSYIKDDKEIIISYCDYGTEWNFKQFITQTRKYNSDGALACYTGFHPHMLGTDNYAFVKKEGHWVKQIQEKQPFTDNKMEEEASNGTYYFKTGTLVKKYFQQLIDSNQTVNGEYYVSMVYNHLIKDNLNVSTFLIQKMLQWGTPYDLEVYKKWTSYFKKPKLQPLSNPQGTTLVLPFAGRGSRFSTQGYNLPKSLIKVDDQEMVLRAVSDLPLCDNQIFIPLQDHCDEYKVDEIIQSYYPKSQIVPISSTTEGQACTCEIGITQTKLPLDTPIMISACDNGVYYDPKKYDELVNDLEVDIIVWAFKGNPTSKNNPNAYAWLDVDSQGFIKYVSCKNFIYDDPLSTPAIIGTMFFRKAEYFLNGLRQNYSLDSRVNGEFYVDDVLNRNIEDGLKVKVFEVEDYICWGTPNDLNTYLYWKEHFLN
jgi:dTDP-glucose pyrophosphorylase